MQASGRGAGTPLNRVNSGRFWTGFCRGRGWRREQLYLFTFTCLNDVIVIPCACRAECFFGAFMPFGKAFPGTAAGHTKAGIQADIL